jgi:hypothetical protein
MTAHSIEGYLSAVKIRERATLLVEGKNDKKTLDRLHHAVLSAGSGSSSSLVVDTTELIGSSGGLGAREVVEATYTQAAAEGLDFAGVVDREYRGFEFHPDLRDDLGAHQVEGEALFWTRGHSIENYYFIQECILEFLALQFPHVLCPPCRAVISQSFSSILAYTCAVSLAARELGILKRCHGLSEPGHWLGSTPAMSFDVPALCAGVNARGGSVDTGAAVKLVRDYLGALGRTEDAMIRWATHGNIGFDMMWTGVAKVVAPWCRETEDFEQIATGYIDLKVRVAAQEWVRRVENAQEDEPTALIDWLKMHKEAA